MTQNQRVLAALHRAGARGLTAVEFDLPNVVDGGPPIQRVAARVRELRDLGHHIGTKGRRSRSTVYVLAGGESRHAQPPVGGAGTPGQVLIVLRWDLPDEEFVEITVRALPVDEYAVAA